MFTVTEFPMMRYTMCGSRCDSLFQSKPCILVASSGASRQGPIRSMMSPVFPPGPSALKTFARIVATGPAFGL